MRKGIYQDKNKKWYIKTKVKVGNSWKTCTIRGFSSKKQANDNFEREIEKWKRNHVAVSSDNAFHKVLDEYLEYRSKIVRAESIRKDKTQFRYYEAIFGNDNLDAIFDDLRLKYIYQEIISSKELSSQKKMRLVLCFRDFTKFCYLAKYIPQETYNNVNFVFLPVKEDKQDRKDKRYIPKSDVSALLSEINKVNDNLFALAISVLYNGGLRISELLGLLTDDIDLTKSIIYVRRQLLTNGEITTTLKTSNSYRQVPISSNLLKQFDTYLGKCNKDISISSRMFEYSHTNFKRKLSEYEKRAGIPNYSCHEFRHTFCTDLAKKITNMSEVSYCARVSGHTSSIFLNTYVKSLDDELVNKFF